MTTKKISLNFILMNLLLLVSFVELAYPPISVYGNATIIRIVCILSWLAISFLSDSDFYLHSSFRVTYVLIFFGLTVLLPYISGAGVIGNRYLALSMIPLGYLIFCFYKRHNMLTSLLKTLAIPAVLLTITMFRTLDALIESPHISRSIKSSGEYSEGLAAQGIGGYHFIYMMVAVAVVVLYVFFKDKRFIVRAIAMGFFLVSFFLIIKSSYVTALITVFAASLVLIILNYAKQGNAISTLIFIFIAILSFILLFNLTSIINTFADVLPERIARVLVTDNQNSVYESLIEEFTVDRWPRMAESIDAAIKNPFLGLIVSSDLNISGEGLTGFGQHSHILDTFALYGIGIGLVNVFVMLRPFKDDNGKRIKRGKALNIAMFVAMAGVLFFNNATDSIAVIFGIVFPLVREIYNPEEQLNETVK